MRTLSVADARRLALWCGGLTASARDRTPQDVLERFGYLQLDTVAVAGARSHALVLMSRLPDLDPAEAERLLAPGRPLFEYWGHEASWLPLRLYPAFAFRRAAFAHHPWFGDVLAAHPEVGDAILRRLAEEGPLRSADFEGPADGGWWGWKPAKRVLAALWSRGEVAVRERVGFQRLWDLAERTLPERSDLPWEAALPILLEQALRGLGWAEERTLRDTFRLRGVQREVHQALRALAAEGRVEARRVDGRDGWVRREDLATAPLTSAPRGSPVLLSPFDPLLWDRARVQHLFGFEALLEIFKPAAQRRWGYFCVPLLRGERLIGRVDLARRGRTLHTRAWHPEPGVRGASSAAARAVARHAARLGLRWHDTLDTEPSAG